MDGAYSTHTTFRSENRKRPLGRRMHRFEDNIRLDVWVVGWKGLD